MGVGCWWGRNFLKKTAKAVKKHYVFHQNRCKSSTFDENPCRFFKKNAKTVKYHYVSHQNRSKSGTFDENPCRFLRKTQTSEKTVCFSREKKSPCIIHDIIFDFYEKTAAKAKGPSRPAAA